jgi:SAM-dependent methyltransferase
MVRGAITPEHVRWAYRLFLEREPESDKAIADHMQARSIQAMRQNFMRSPEFRGKNAEQNGAAFAVPLDAPENVIEVTADEATLSALASRVQRCWERLGRQRPYHSVLTNPDFLPTAFKDNEDAFWRSGDAEADVLMGMLSRHGVVSTGDLTCIDFGCGAGRITAPLTHHFASVHAYDVSASHLGIARSRAPAATFHHIRELPVTFVQADVFFSRIVLQHNPPPIIAALLKDAFACLKPGGFAAFQVPTYEIGYGFSVKSYLERVGGSEPDMEMHCFPQRHVFRLASETGCHVLEVREDGATGRFGRDVSNTFLVQRPA